MKVAFLRLCCFILLVTAGMTAYAYDFEADAIYYNILPGEGNAVEVTYDKGNDYSGDVVIPAEVSYKGVVYDVTNIGESAFENCRSLISIDMPSVTMIDNRAFFGCSSLTLAGIPIVTTIGDWAFGYCSSLVSVAMPLVANIGETAFYDCDNLSFVDTPLLTSVGADAFSDCDNLTFVSMPSAITIGDGAFIFCNALTSVEMPSVTTIGDKAFYYCSALTSVSLPSATTIGDEAFFYCTALSSVSLPSVMTIGERAFEDCIALSSVSMLSITTIGDYAFMDCSALTSVDIPASCTFIGSYPFAGCIALKEIVVDENNPNYSSSDGAFYNKNKNILICWPAAEGGINLPLSVTKIGVGAFYNCSTLTSIEMPSVKTISNSAFGSCSALTSVEMPMVETISDGAFNACRALASVSMPAVTTIGANSFSLCGNLSKVDIPASVSMIGSYAFTACSGLTSVYCHWEEPLECEPEFTSEVLMNATLYVPDGCADAYRSVYPWSEFANIEEGGYSGIADTPESGLSVKVIDGVITVEGGDGTASAPGVEVYSAGGVCVYRGTDSSIGGLPRGVYVVKVGSTVQKVAL